MREALGQGAGLDDGRADPDPVAGWGPEHVAHPALYLSHESCPVNGEAFFAGGGRIARMFLAETRGLVDPDLTAERLRDSWDVVNDISDCFVPRDVPHWHNITTAHHSAVLAAER